MKRHKSRLVGVKVDKAIGQKVKTYLKHFPYLNWLGLSYNLKQVRAREARQKFKLRTTQRQCKDTSLDTDNVRHNNVNSETHRQGMTYTVAMKTTYPKRTYTVATPNI